MTAIFEVSRRMNLPENEEYVRKRLSQIEEQIRSVSPQSITQLTIQVVIFLYIFD